MSLTFSPCIPAYDGGKPAANLYNAGNMITDDEKDFTPEDCPMQLITETNESEFDAYIAKLLANGFEIVFENKNANISVGTKVGEYHSHPAFQAFDTNGLWVGKFETTGETTNLTIKPGLKALVKLNAKSMIDAAFNFNRNSDSHLIKNTEWGAVAYLSHSKYGINDQVKL